MMNRTITLVYGQTGMGKTVWTKQHLRGQKRIICLDPIEEYEGVRFEDLEKLLDYTETYRSFYCCYSVVPDFGLLCQVALAVRDCVLVVEESQRVVPPRMTPPGAFEDVIYRGRHSRVSVVLVSQRPTTLHIAARSQWTRLVSFRQTEPADYKWIENTAGFALDLAGLEPLHYFDVTPGAWAKKVLDVPWKSARIKAPGDSRTPTMAPDRGGR